MRDRCLSGHVVRPFVSDTYYVTESIDREGLERRRTGTTHKTPEAYKGKGRYFTSLTSDSTSTATIFFAFISSFRGFNT